MKIYTKTGDKGTTSLVGGERVVKTDERVEAYGTVDELTAFTALLTDHLRGDNTLTEQVEALNRILSQLMSVAALLATGAGGNVKTTPICVETIAWLEARIDAMQATLPPITKFTIPGGHPTLSECHVCRTICRRAERAALRADQTHGVDGSALIYLNRLSDYFYLLGRTLTEHYAVKEILWIP
ncbi:MAG: cob(I)yrinic acid a,c-diamide adenosyltransferase [Alistipes sp.]